MNNAADKAVLLRLKILATCGFLFFGGLAARLYQMQVVQGATYEKQARLNAMVPEIIPAVRGRIVDAHGRVLVSNEPRFYLAVVPNEVRNIYHTTDMLAAALGTDAAALQKKMRRLEKE